jgi:hypothetical protein
MPHSPRLLVILGQDRVGQQANSIQDCITRKRPDSLASACDRLGCERPN